MSIQMLKNLYGFQKKYFHNMSLLKSLHRWYWKISTNTVTKFFLYKETKTELYHYQGYGKLFKKESSLLLEHGHLGSQSMMVNSLAFWKNMEASLSLLFMVSAMKLIIGSIPIFQTYLLILCLIKACLIDHPIKRDDIHKIYLINKMITCLLRYISIFYYLLLFNL